MKTFLIRGVPQALQQDGWWLNAGGPGQDANGEARAKGNADGWRVLVLLALIALGDVLIWNVVPGLSLAAFGGAVMLAALWLAGSRIGGQGQALIVGGGVLALLPLVELVQPLSVMIAIFGVSGLLALLAGLKPSEVARGALRLWPMGVRQTFVDATQALQSQDTGNLNGMLTRVLMAWLFPIVMGIIFVFLLLAANPVAARWADRLWQLDVTLPDGARMIFWLCLVPVGWTALSLVQMREQLRATPRARHMGPERRGLINPASVTRALVIFNAVFALQTAMDVIYLYGGAGLPEGISYAEYAHRGAYPLVATGLLAGAFALMTRRWVQGDAVLRVLLMLWVGQNVALVVSSIVRLELYVETYGLTHLRMAAGIWMGLTAAALALILWQIWARRDNVWLVLRGGAMTVVVLYGCAFISFDKVIARYNLSDINRLDTVHLCWLGEGAVPLIAAYEMRHNVRLCHNFNMQIGTPSDWREWGFRNWRARTSLAALNAEAYP